MNRNIIYATLVVLLAACGGSSENSDTEVTQKDNTSNNTPRASISVKALNVDACGNTSIATDAALIIHNNDYSNKEVILADANGSMSYETDNNTETISVLLRGVDEVSGVKPFDIRTYIDHPIIDLGTVYTSSGDTSLCNCFQNTLSVNVPDRPADTGDAELFGAQRHSNILNYVGYSEIEGIEQCSKVGEQPPLVTTIIDFINPAESYAAVIENIQQASSVSAELWGQPVNIVSPDSYRQVSAFIDDNHHLISFAFDASSNVYSYPVEQAEFYSIAAYSFEDIYEIPDIDRAYILRYSNIATTNINQTFDLPLLPINYVELLEVLTSETGSYAISYAGELDFMNVSIIASSYMGSILDWYIYAPTSGQVPNIENLDLSAFISDVDLDANIDTLSIAVGARDYIGISDYDDFLRSKVTRDAGDFANDKWSKMDWANFRVTMSGVGISSMAKALPVRLANIDKKRENTKYKPTKNDGTSELIKKELAIYR